MDESGEPTATEPVFLSTLTDANGDPTATVPVILSTLTDASGNPTGTSSIVSGGVFADTTSTGTSTDPSSSASPGSAASNEDVAPPGVIAGGVIGSVAGAVILVVLAFMILRWRRNQRRPQPVTLPEDGRRQMAPVLDPFADPRAPPAPPTERSSATPAPFAAAAFARRRKEAHPPGESGFQRISGRKLPSAFSPGMTQDQIAQEAAKRDTMLSDVTSGSRISQGSGSASEGEQPREMPGPARTPVIHHAGLWAPNLSPTPEHPAAPVGATLAPSPRPGTGRTGSFNSHRGSRFTEDVV